MTKYKYSGESLDDIERHIDELQNIRLAEAINKITNPPCDKCHETHTGPCKSKFLLRALSEEYKHQHHELHGTIPTASARHVEQCKSELASLVDGHISQHKLRQSVSNALRYQREGNHNIKYTPLLTIRNRRYVTKLQLEHELKRLKTLLKTGKRLNKYSIDFQIKKLQERLNEIPKQHRKSN